MMSFLGMNPGTEICVVVQGPKGLDDGPHLLEWQVIRVTTKYQPRTP